MFLGSLSPDPVALATALLLEIIERPVPWRGHLVTPYIHPSIHPVALVYKAASRLVKPGGAFRGVAVLLAVVAPMAALALLFTAVRGEGLEWSLLEGYLLKLSFSITQVTRGCGWGYGIGRPHAAVREFVRRRLDPSRRGLVNSACVETMAESLVDSYVSPLMWYIAMGLPGAWIQRAVNTADGLVGFREYKRLGAPSALLDTVMNYIPARFTALLILSAGVRGLEALAQRRQIESVNAKWPISAMAAALGATLEKEGHYSVGAGGHPTELDVAYAMWITHRAAAAAALIFYTLAMSA
ncbi:MAG: CobD/CbiB family cobalamin biosynthesis protein [Pyrobaculum sp.]